MSSVTPISANALAGTTAIPLLVQRSLQTPTPPAANSTPTPSPQVSPSPTSPQMAAPATSPQKPDQE